MKKLLSVFLSVVLLIPFSAFFFSFAAGHEIFVAPNGDDGNDGSLAAPLATLSAAKERAKAVGENTIVYFRQGIYTFYDTVAFDSSDQANVTYQAYNGERVVFTAGKAYTGFERCTVNGVEAFKKSVGNDAAFNVLLHAEQTLKRTRYPVDGYLYAYDQSIGDVLNPDDDYDYVNYYYHTTGLITKEKIPAFKNPNDIFIRILHYWKDEMATVTGFDAANGRLTFSRPTSMSVKKGDRFFFENVFEMLREPGEWYLDKAEGVLYYIPFAGEQPDTLTLWGAETETMISVNGVDGISFEHIQFWGNGFNIPHANKGMDESSQAGYDAQPCVAYRCAKHFAVKNCDFKHIAGCAVFLGEAVRNAAIDSNYFEQLGAQAVYIRGRNISVDDPMVTGQITVSNNIVNGYGRVFFNAVGVLIIHANSIDVLHNEIHDGYYTAISVGWSWGYNYSVTYNNHICDNLIYDIGQGWLSDMGGIYTLGVQPGTVLSGNCIHNVAADPGEGGYGGWGIYPDEGSSDMLIEKNLVFACGNDSYHLHYGENNTVRNNIFALSSESQVRVVSRVEDKFTAAFSDNILLTDGKAATFSHMNKQAEFSARHNFLWDLTYGEEVYVNQSGDPNRSMTVARAEKKGWLEDSVIIDPKFRDAARFDFSFAPDSPVLQQGFVAWDYSNAGTIDGTVVGLDHAGGQTSYNANAKGQSYQESFTFWTRIVSFFRVAFAWIQNLFVR